VYAELRQKNIQQNLNILVRKKKFLTPAIFQLKTQEILLHARFLQEMSTKVMNSMKEECEQQ
jgi:hypothetical protein